MASTCAHLGGDIADEIEDCLEFEKSLEKRIAYYAGADGSGEFLKLAANHLVSWAGFAGMCKEFVASFATTWTTVSRIMTTLDEVLETEDVGLLEEIKPDVEHLVKALETLLVQFRASSASASAALAQAKSFVEALMAEELALRERVDGTNDLIVSAKTKIARSKDILQMDEQRIKLATMRCERQGQIEKKFDSLAWVIGSVGGVQSPTELTKVLGSAMKNHVEYQKKNCKDKAADLSAEVLRLRENVVEKKRAEEEHKTVHKSLVDAQKTAKKLALTSTLLARRIERAEVFKDICKTLLASNSLDAIKALHHRLSVSDGFAEEIKKFRAAETERTRAAANDAMFAELISENAASADARKQEAHVKLPPLGGPIGIPQMGWLGPPPVGRPGAMHQMTGPGDRGLLQDLGGLTGMPLLHNLGGVLDQGLHQLIGGNGQRELSPADRGLLQDLGGLTGMPLLHNLGGVLDDGLHQLIGGSGGKRGLGLPIGQEGRQGVTLGDALMHV